MSAEDSADGRTMTYTYLSDGTKLKAVSDGGAGLTYRGSFVYGLSSGGGCTLESVATDEGRIVMDGTAVKDEWHVRDHVGNVRSVVWLNAPAGTSVSASILEQNDYLPFGTRLPGSRTDQSNRYRLGGKEEQEALSDLPYIDFGARLYNPRLGRWLSPDPLAEKYFSMSPYNYCGNDPLNFVDLYGMNPIYSQNGLFLGTDNLGLQGNYIIMDESNFKQGMQNECATEYDLGLAGLNGSDATLSFLISYLGLKDRPDWDGFVTRKEGIKWAKKHPNAIDNATSDNSLYIDASKLDFGNTTIFDLKNGVGATSDINTFNAGNTVNSLFNSKLRHSVYAMGRITLLLNDSSGTVTIENNDASVYDWNNGGTLIRRVAISAERGLHNLNDSHGFPVYYYGTGHIRK